MSVNSSAQFQSASEKYGIPASDPGSDFARNKYQGNPKVHSYSAQNRTTIGERTSWENQNPGAGGGTFQSFDDKAPMQSSLEIK